MIPLFMHLQNLGFRVRTNVGFAKLFEFLRLLFQNLRFSFELACLVSPDGFPLSGDYTVRR